MHAEPRRHGRERHRQHDAAAQLDGYNTVCREHHGHRRRSKRGAAVCGLDDGGGLGGDGDVGGLDGGDDSWYGHVFDADWEPRRLECGEPDGSEWGCAEGGGVAGGLAAGCWGGDGDGDGDGDAGVDRIRRGERRFGKSQL